MKQTLRLILGGLFAVAFTVASHAADLVAGPFEARDVRGTVTYKDAGSDAYQPVVSGQALKEGVSIKTAANSSVSILFKSGATAMIRPNSEIEVTKFEQALFSGGTDGAEEPAVSNTQIALVNGEVISNVKKLKATSQYVVNTPVGAAGVRGTFFNVRFDAVNRTMTVGTLSGSVVVTLRDGSASEIANTNEQITIAANALLKDVLSLVTRQYLEGFRNLLVKELQAIFPNLDASQIGVSPGG